VGGDESDRTLTKKSINQQILTKKQPFYHRERVKQKMTIQMKSTSPCRKLAQARLCTTPHRRNQAFLTIFFSKSSTFTEMFVQQ